MGSATLAPVVQICAKADLTTCFTADFTTATGVTAVVPTGSTTATSVTAQIPPGLGENLTLKLTLTQGTLTVDSGTTGQNSFKYVTPTSPAVARVANQLPTSGGVLSITGSRLGPLGGTKVTRVVWNNGILDDRESHHHDAEERAADHHPRRRSVHPIRGAHELQLAAVNGGCVARALF